MNWVNQVPVFEFNSGKYDLNLVKEYFVRTLSNMNNVTVAKKDNSYMFLMTPMFKFLDIKNYLAPGLSYDGWRKANGCAVSKIVFPYEWLDDYNKLSHVGPVKYTNFFSKLKGGFTITPSEYNEFVREFHSRGCVTMMDWLRVYNEADVIPFIEAVNKTRKQYYPNEIDMFKDAVSIPGISMTYVLNKALKMKKPGDPDLNAPEKPCEHKCNEECIGCKDCKRVRSDCTQCAKNKPYELLKTGMVGGPSIIFCRYAAVGVSQTRAHKYADAKVCKSINRWDASSLYLYCSGQEMPTSK